MDTTAEGQTVLRRRASGWIAALVAAIFFCGLALAFAILAGVLLLDGSISLGLTILALAAWIFILADYVWRDCQAKRGWLIGIEPGELFLDLPAGRSLMVRSSREKARLQVSDVVAIETRLEAYRSFGLASMQRSYGLRLKSGRLIVLGEDRALATNLADGTMGQMADLIALKTGLPLRDLGMVEGKGGFLGVLFTSVPGWEAPGLPSERQTAHWQRAGITGGLACIVAIVALILSTVL